VIGLTRFKFMAIVVTSSDSVGLLLQEEEKGKEGFSVFDRVSRLRVL